MIRKYIVAFLICISCFATFCFFSASAEATFVEPDAYMSGAIDFVRSERPKTTDYYFVHYRPDLQWYLIYFFDDNLPFDIDTSQTNNPSANTKHAVSYTVALQNASASLPSQRYSIRGSSESNYSFNQWVTSDIQIMYCTFDVTKDGQSFYDSPSNAPDAPFTVTVTPELYEGMSPNIISFPSRGDGQTITTTNYTLNFELSLNSQFVDFFGVSDLAEYGYSYTCFVIPSEYVSDDIDEMAKHSIYNYVYKGYFTHDETEVQHGINIGMQPITESSKDWRVGEGWTNIRSISCSSPTDSFLIYGDNIDFSKYPSDSYSFVIHSYQFRADKRIGNIPSTWYFMNTSSHLFSEKASFTKSTEDTDSPWGDLFGEPSPENETFEYYRQYTWISDKFSYSEIPELSPSDYEQSLGDGLIPETNPFEFQRNPSKVWDDEGLFSHDEDGNIKGTNAGGYTPDEWEQVVDQRKWSDNFSSDYGVGSFTDIFKGSSNVFKFITASLSVLPSWFMTIITSFFVALLSVIFLKLFL